MKHLSFNGTRANRIIVDNYNVLYGDCDFVDNIAARIVDLTGKPDWTFDYIVNYLYKVYPYQYLEDRCSFTPAEMRCLRALRAFLTYVGNHGAKAPLLHVWMDLNTGKNICLVNTSDAASTLKVEEAYQE
jgi:hypothetical protein